MDREIINQVEVTEAGELLLCLEGKGKPMYQYVYREAAGVYWDEIRHGFKSTQLKEWPCSKWFFHIVSIVKTSLGVELKLSSKAIWKNIPEQDQAKIVKENAI